MNAHPDAEPLYLGIDFGTSGCRAALLDGDARLQAQTAVTLPSPIRNGNAVEQDPAIWLHGLTRLLGQLPRQQRARTRAIAIDGTSASVLLTDAAGQPLSAALMYNDSRASEQAARIAACAPSDSPALGPGSSLAKALWLLEQTGQRTDHAAHILHQADWLSGWLLGDYGHSDENNSLKLGYDPQQRRWPDWLKPLLPSPGLLPRVTPAGTAVGTLSDHPEIATQFGFPLDTRIISGSTDSTAAFIATGAAGIGDAVTTLGSTLVLKVLSEKPISSPRHGVYSHRLGDLWLVGGASNSGGAVLRQHFDEPRMTELSRQLDFAHPSHLDYYPLPGPGERFPIADPALPPRLQPRPDDDLRFFQGLLEGIARIEQQGYQLLHQLGAPWPTRIISSGGGAANRTWGNYRSRLMAIPESPAEQTEAAYGAALLAWRSDTRNSDSRQPTR